MRFSNILSRGTTATIPVGGKGRSLETDFLNERTEQLKYKWLEASKAQPASLALYALWLRAYIDAGGKATRGQWIDHFPTGDTKLLAEAHSSRMTPQDADTSGENAMSEAVRRYFDQNVLWVPTRATTLSLPTNTGAGSFEVLNLSNLVKLPSVTLQREFGHNILHTLKIFPSGRIDAATSNPHHVTAPRDVEDLIFSSDFYSNPEIADLLGSLNSGHLPSGLQDAPVPSS